MLDQVEESCGERSGVIRPNQYPIFPIVDNLQWTALAGCDNRLAQGHRFYNGHSERLWPNGGIDDDI